MSKGLWASESFSLRMSDPEVSEARGPCNHKIQVQPIIIWKNWELSNATNDFSSAQVLCLNLYLKTLSLELSRASKSLRIVS